MQYAIDSRMAPGRHHGRAGGRVMGEPSRTAKPCCDGRPSGAAALLAGAIGYPLGACVQVAPEEMTLPTPSADCDLEALLAHLAEHGPGGADLGADVLVVGIGAAPNDALAADAGLEVSNGVLTDAALRTSDLNIFAAGDVANSFHPLLGRRVRVEHWANALNGGPAAARSMLGQPVVYDPVPYFYSDQYDLGMECAGLPS